MSGTQAEVLKARAEAAAARARITATVARLRHRLDPRVRAREKWEDVREKGESLGDEALEFAYERPKTVAAAVGTGAIFLCRRPLARLARRIGGLFRRKPRPVTKSAGAASPPPGQRGARS